MPQGVKVPVASCQRCKDEEGEFGLMDFKPEEAPQVERMRLEPVTAVDDPDLGARMKANVNLPDCVKAIF